MAFSDFESIFNDQVVPTFQNYFGVDVCLARGPLSTATFTARRGDREHSAIGQEYGLEIKITMRDFLLPASAMVIDDDDIEPRQGDRIVEGDEIFEIQPADEKKPAVELQAGGFEWLVHTKRIQ